MTSIDPTSRLLAYLRQQAETLRHEYAGRGAATARTTPGRPAAEQRPPLGAAIAAIDRADPDAGRKAFRFFLEATLLRELGEALAADPGFPALVDRVLAAMEADDSLKPAVAEAGTLLLATHRKSP